MTTDTDLSGREYRLARYYLNKLRTVDDAVRRGQIHVSYGLAIFDQEWEQIRHWQTWTTQRKPEDIARAELCKEFALAGLEVLANRNNAADHVAWLQAALEAAQQLADAEAERTLCYELEMASYRLGSLEMGRQYACQLLSLGEAADDILSIERAFFGLAVYSEERGRYSEAEQHYQRALQLSNQLGIATETGRVLNGLGGIACIIGDFQKAYQYFSQYLELMEIHGKKNKVCHALLSLGECLIGLKAYAEAEQRLQGAVRMCRALGFQRLLGVGLLTLGTLAIAQNNLAAAKSYVQEGMQAVRAAGVPRQIIYGLTRLGYIALQRGDYAGALAHLNEGLEMARAVGSPRHTCDVHIVLGNAYLAMNDLSASRKALHDALTIAQRHGLRPQQVQILSSVVAYQHSIGQHDRAAHWAGVLLDEPLRDAVAFEPMCAQLEAALGREGYQQALAEGKQRSFDDVVSDILACLA